MVWGYGGSGVGRAGAKGLADVPDGDGAEEEEQAADDEHEHRLRRAVGAHGEEAEHEAAAEGGDYLRDADGAVEEAEVGADMVAAEGVGEDGEWHGQHGGPCAAHEGVADAEQGRRVNEPYGYEADGADEQAERVAELAAAEGGEDGSPDYGGDGLDGEKDAVPVAGVLIGLAGGVEHRDIVERHLLGRGRGRRCGRW